jgi:hypothetical protein
MDRYALPPAKRLIVRLIALVFFALGLMEVTLLPLPATAPHFVNPAWDSRQGWIGEPEAVLPEPARFRLAADPAMRARFVARLQEPSVRTMNFVLSLMIDLAVIVMLGGMGMALWRSTRLVPDAVESGLPWLMAVGWSCVAMAIGMPIIDGFRTALLLRGVMSAPTLFWYDPDSGGTTELALLIAAGILAATWTISAGLKARRDMAEIV